MLSDILKGLVGGAKTERFLAVDIGTSAIKLLELDTSGAKPKLVSATIGPTPAGAINNNMIVKQEQVAEAIKALIEANDIEAKLAVVAIPGPSAFTKKVTMGATKLKELETNIAFEAGNYIPHKIEAVHLDFQVTKILGNSSLEVLLVAVKNEIIASYVETIAMTGLEPAVADIDYFAIENMFEVNYPEERGKMVAIVNIGARYSSVNILLEGNSLFTGDVGVGGRLYTDALCETLQLQPRDAEAAKAGQIPEGVDPSLVKEVLERTTEHVSAELHRQLGFFWNAAATDRSIEEVYVCGGGSQLEGLLEELGVKTGITCKRIESLRNIDTSQGFDADYLGEIAPSIAAAVGLGLRRFGDKAQPEGMT